jgi:hypothetical protein
VSRLGFLSPDGAAPGVALVSPLGRALPEQAAGGVRDVSSLGKLELRGEIEAVEEGPGEELIRITPRRALLVTEGSTAAARERLHGGGCRVYDMTAALGGLEVEGEDLLRRLTDLDLGRLPAVGPVARGVPAVIERRGGDTFRLFVPQELGHYVAEVVLDAAGGLRA